ncbi:hypothetical protein FBU30_007792 [Linnemannia zychae]|nr:hypothetical protein FBU30_007792 [Linnemannia zychae]
MTTRPISWANTLALLSITLLLCFSRLPTPTFAAPAKHVPAPGNLVNAMALTFSDTSKLPLQLQIESQIRGTQKLAYLPTSGPGLDFYYLNYRPTYIAGQSTIDFWMISPKGSQAPKAAGLELYDEFGRVRLATLVKEGTEVPQALANTGEPFLWKSWVIPKELKADFDFSEKFRVVLTTSNSVKDGDAADAAETVKKADKRKKMTGKKVVKVDRRSSPLMLMHKLFKRAAPATENVANEKNNTPVKASNSVVVVQDRQFRIKGLKAMPGGKPNPAKTHVNSIAPIANGKTTERTTDNTKTDSPLATPASNTNKDAATTPNTNVVTTVAQTESRIKSSASVKRIDSSIVVQTTFFAAILSFLVLLL